MPNLDTLSDVIEGIRAGLDDTDAAREGAFRHQRQVIRAAASTIRALHRGELSEAESLLAECRELCGKMTAHASGSPAIATAGFVMDAQKEFAEAALLLAILHDRELPTPHSLGIEGAPYLNGLAEAAGELRRAVLDALQKKQYDAAQQWVEAVDTIYHLLVSFDYADAIVYGLKRRLDMVRGVFERTQSDVLTTVRQSELQAALERLEGKLP